MSRLSILLFAVVAACGPKKPPPTSPLPPDKPTEPAPPPVTEAPKQPDGPPGQPNIAGPAEITLPAAQVTVKLVSPGKGKRAPLRYSAKAGGKQQLELAMDWQQTQTESGKKSAPTIMPTIVLAGEAETTAVDKDVATNVLTISTTDARDVAGAVVAADKFKTLLTSLASMVITSTVDPAGVASDVKLMIAKPDQFTGEALQIVMFTLPTFPSLPSEPVGLGAKWQATSNFLLAGKVKMTQITDYEVTARTGNTWTVKGTSKVAGIDQDVGDGTKITGIKGGGTIEMSLADGALYPTTKGSLSTEFTAVDSESTLVVALKVGGAITPKK